MEIWKDVKNYEGLYQVSNYGAIKSLKKTIKMPNSGFRVCEEIILKKRISTNGYFYVNLCIMGKPKTKTIHRLVAINFIENPNNFKCVGHLDDVKTNNNLDNLEWCSHAQNNQRAYDTGLKVGTYLGIKGKDNPSSKAVYQYSTSGDFIKKWDSQYDITRELGFPQSALSAVCTGRQKTSKGFIWKFKKEWLS